jgi:hypothetical protein
VQHDIDFSSVDSDDVDEVDRPRKKAPDSIEAKIVFFFVGVSFSSFNNTSSPVLSFSLFRSTTTSGGLEGGHSGEVAGDSI